MVGKKRIRLWLLPQGAESRILTGDEMRRRDVHPLRCVYLGLFGSANDPAAVEAARREARPAADIIAANVRRAVEMRLTRRFRLSEQELDLLRTGETLRIRDGLGQFAVGYVQKR